MFKYPKIETLFERDENFKVTDKIRLSEFENIKNWLITEKIDGTNIRIIFDKTCDDPLDIRGRTDNAQIPPFLLKELHKMFQVEKIAEIFDGANKVCLYGEGYGAKIQKGGGNYNKGNSFRLFDIWIDGCWLEWDSVEEIAKQLGVKTVPVIAKTDLKAAIYMVECGNLFSAVSLVEGEVGHKAEGIVARAYPTMLFRRGNPIKWKLKVKDYN